MHLEPPSYILKNARTAGVCDRTGAFATPVLSPALKYAGSFGLFLCGALGYSLRPNAAHDGTQAVTDAFALPFRSSNPALHEKAGWCRAGNRCAFCRLWW